MTHDPTPAGGDPRPVRYEIRLAGAFDAHWTAWFGGMAVRLEDDGTTLISGVVPDQAALHGLLQRVRDLGTALISVARIDPRPGHSAPHDTNQPTTPERSFT